MAPNRRNGASTPKPTPHTNPPNPATQPTSTSPPLQEPRKPHWPSTLLPNPPELLLLSTYPLLLLSGSLFSTLSPTTRNAPYNPTTQSHPAPLAPSYFALKSNILNTFFVKIAWFWISLAYALFLTIHPAHGPGILGTQGLVLTPKRLRGVVRWAAVTVWWGIVTQWFFGPGVIDRGFRLTGGACELADGYRGTGGGKEFVTSQACKAVGGLWRGGHDISGHVFILVLGSAFLGFEVLPVLTKSGREERRVRSRDGSVGVVEMEDVRQEQEGEGAKVGLMPVVGVMGVSAWMLLMTATFFHTWFEKFTGLLVAFVGIGVVYFLPRAVPSMRDVVGMPGI